LPQTTTTLPETTTGPLEMRRKPSLQIHIWPQDHLQRWLLGGVIFINFLFFVLFIVYIVLAFVSPDRLDKLDFRPAVDDDLGLFLKVVEIWEALWENFGKKKLRKKL
jgi:hypothetical protein